MNKVNLISICGLMVRDNDIGEAFSMYIQSKLHFCDDCDIYEQIYSIDETEINKLHDCALGFVDTCYYDTKLYLNDYSEDDELNEEEKQEVDNFNKICEACEYYREKLQAL